METLSIVSLILNLIGLVALYYVYQRQSGSASIQVTSETTSARAYIQCNASATPTAQATPMPLASWNIVSSRNMTMDTDGTVTIPSNGMYTISGTQSNRNSSAAIGIRMEDTAGTMQTIWQSSPSTDITTSSLVNTVTIYCLKGTKVAVVYAWNSRSSTGVTAGPETIFSVVSVD